MVFDEMGLEHGKTLLLLPGTCCNYETNFGIVLEELGKHYHLICVNYDGFDGSDQIFPDMITVTKKIEEYIKEKHAGRVDGALGSSLGGSFVGQLIMRRNIHEFDMQHEQWLFGDNGWTKPVLETIYACMEMPV